MMSSNTALLPDLPGNWLMRYRRSTTPGATYFFTAVTYRRRAILREPETVALLREAFATVKQRHPFRIDAVVILPARPLCATNAHKRAQTIGQPRYWEHQIRDDRDFERHCDYLHDNPVKHALVARVAAG